MIAGQRILLTGAGGPSAISVWKSLKHDHIVHMADMDANAAGLYLVAEGQRALLPRGDSPDLVGRLLDLCRRWGIDILIPTVDVELAPVAEAEARFAAIGTRCAVSGRESLRVCADKHVLLARMASVVSIPRSRLLTDQLIDLSSPKFVKPRISAGSRGARRIETSAQLAGLPRDGSLLIQDFLPGTEYSVDVYLRADGHAVVSVVRERMKIDSGIAVAARTVHLPLLADAAVAAARAVGIRYVGNVQFRRDSEGEPRLLEINPRFPGTLPLTRLAGVDLPALLVAELGGDTMPEAPLAYRETMMVRYLEEVAVDPAEWRRLAGR